MTRPKSTTGKPAIPTPGICYLVGAGPGDPGLLTLKARDCIAAADVLIYDYLVAPEILAHARPDCEKIYAGKQAGNHALPQDEINALIIRLTREGKTVTRLKGGDPYLFGRGGEEAAELAAAGLAFEVVPGISSALAGPAYAGIPVTHRAHNTTLTIFTGHEDPTKEISSLDFAKLAAADGTKVMLMGIGRLAELSSQMLAHGADPATPVALVRWATTPRQQTLIGTLADIAAKAEAAAFKAPAVCVIGSAVTLRDELNWFEQRPLFGRRAVVTRTREQAGELSRRLAALGAGVQELPVIRTAPPEDLRAFAELVKDAHTYQWIIFTSPNGVDVFFDWFYKLFQDARAIGGVRVAAVGPATAAKIRSFHLAVDLMPGEHTAEGLVAAFKEHGSIDNEMMLWVRPEQARPVISRELAALGAIVDEAIAYRTLPAEVSEAARADFAANPPDLITFTSASTAEHFFNLGLPLAPTTRLASIGPVTTAALRQLGHPPHIEAADHHIDGLVTAIAADFAG